MAYFLAALVIKPILNTINSKEIYMGNEMSNDEWLSVDKVADELKLKPVTVKRYAREGLLNGKQENNEWRFLSSDIEKFKAIQAKL
tara:strand:+ start:207 stop:464 length:258 start_codon:yes stop_codon:yes gene_type:complete